MACIDFKVKCVRFINDAEQYFTVGKVYDVANGRLVSDTGSVYEAWALPINGNGDFEALRKWFASYYTFELVEDKKMFTKEDLKTGMFGVMSGNKNFCIVGDSLIYQDGGFDRVKSLSNDLCFSIGRIEKVYEGVLSFNNLDAHLRGSASNPVSLVYDRERDTKKSLYNGKVVCVKNTPSNHGLYTVGKIYQFVDGSFVANDGSKVKDWYKPVESFEQWNSYSSSEWVEIKE